jgi:hypothetical protein
VRGKSALSEYDLELLPILLEGRARLWTPRQVAERAGDYDFQTRAALERLRNAGLIAALTLLGQRPAGSQALTRPLAVREKGEPCPDLRAVIHKVRSRRMVDFADWICEGRRCREHTAYYATERAFERFGGVMPGAPKLHQAAHDVCTTDLYLAVWRNRPHLAATWLSEDAWRAQHPSKLGVPDAVAVDTDGTLRGFEYVTISYDIGRLEKFDRDCEALGIAAWEMF